MAGKVEIGVPYVRDDTVWIIRVTHVATGWQQYVGQRFRPVKTKAAARRFYTEKASQDIAEDLAARNAGWAFEKEAVAK